MSSIAVLSVVRPTASAAWFLDVVILILHAVAVLMLSGILAAADTPPDESAASAPFRADIKPPQHALWQLTEVDQLLDQASGNDVSWTRAVEALRPWRLIAVAQASVRLHGQHDLVARRLTALCSDHLADHRGIAESVWKASEALATCAGNDGPRQKEFGTAQLGNDRQTAKIIHFFLIGNDPYLGQLESADFWQVSSTDWRDEKAAAELYLLAARLYDDLITKDTDPALRSADLARAGRARQQAEHCLWLYSHVN